MGRDHMDDEHSSDLTEDIGELKTMMFMFGSQFAFTNAPRNLIILSLLVSLIGISATTGYHWTSDNTDWEPMEATVLETDTGRSHCTSNGLLQECRYNGHFPEVFFSWTVDEETYFSWEYMVYPPNLSSDARVDRWLGDRGLTPGENVTGFVNPDDPSEAVLVTQSVFSLLLATGDILFALCCSLCNVIPILLLLSARSFERVIPRERRKRYKLEYKGNRSWDAPLEAKELQAEARNIKLKGMSSDLSDEQFEELTSISEYMDSEATPMEGGNRSFTVLLGGGQEKTFEVRSEGDLLNILSNIDDDLFVLYLDESKKEGRLLEFRYIEEQGEDDKLRIREFSGQDPVSEETVNIERDMSKVMTIVRQALRNSEKSDEKWWS
ncbi:MAG: DUF3592 domain-containing protein [Candidatus Poseidoniales archaeon]|nr:MAG: DUF3592 domain-containing protein [Candidatus Poseidoniales archaeon]